MYIISDILEHKISIGSLVACWRSMFRCLVGGRKDAEGFLAVTQFGNGGLAIRNGDLINKKYPLVI